MKSKYVNGTINKDIYVHNDTETQRKIATLEEDVHILEQTKQDNLIAGENITIEDNVISAQGGLDPEQLVTVITAESTDEQVPSAKAVWNQAAKYAKSKRFVGSSNNPTGFMLESNNIADIYNAQVYGNQMVFLYDTYSKITYRVNYCFIDGDTNNICVFATAQHYDHKTVDPTEKIMRDYLIANANPASTLLQVYTINPTDSGQICYILGTDAGGDDYYVDAFHSPSWDTVQDILSNNGVVALIFNNTNPKRIYYVSQYDDSYIRFSSARPIDYNINSSATYQDTTIIEEFVWYKNNVNYLDYHATKSAMIISVQNGDIDTADKTVSEIREAALIGQPIVIKDTRQGLLNHSFVYTTSPLSVDISKQGNNISQIKLLGMVTGQSNMPWTTCSYYVLTLIRVSQGYSMSLDIQDGTPVHQCDIGDDYSTIGSLIADHCLLYIANGTEIYICTSRTVETREVDGHEYTVEEYWFTNSKYKIGVYTVNSETYWENPVSVIDLTQTIDDLEQQSILEQQIPSVYAVVEYVNAVLGGVEDELAGI